MEKIDKFLEQITNTLGKYSGVKEYILDNPVVESAVDSMGYLRFIKNVSSNMAHKRFESFLKGFSGTEEPTEKQLKRLVSYIDDESKAEFIADAFLKVLLSRSKKGSLIIGSMLNTLTSNNQDVTYNELIGVQALSTFFDEDIENFNLVCQYISDNKVLEFGDSTSLSGCGKEFDKLISDNNMSHISISLTIEKAVANQLLVKMLNTTWAGIGKYNISVTNPGLIVNDLILKCGLSKNKLYTVDEILKRNSVKDTVGWTLSSCKLCDKPYIWRHSPTLKHGGSILGYETKVIKCPKCRTENKLPKSVESEYYW